LAALAANTQPDVACIMGKMCVPLYMTRALLPLKDAVYAANGTNLDKAYFGDGLGAYAWDGDYYGVPMENGCIGNTVSVPVDDIKKLGLESKYPPTNGNWLFESYDHLWECAKALQVEEGGKVKKWGLSSKGWEAAAIIGILRTYGEKDKMDWWDVDKQKFNVDTDAGVNALADYAERPVKKGIETELDVTSVDACMAGRAALGRGNATPVLQGDTVGYNYEIAEVPTTLPGQKRPLTMGEGGWGFVAPRNAKNVNVAVAFLKFMDTDEGALEWEKIYGGKKGPRTALKGKYDHFVDKDPNSKARRTAKWCDDHLMWESAKYYGERMGYPGDIDKIFSEEASNIRTGKQTAAEGAKKITERLDAQLKQFQDDVQRYKEGA
jgi:ABC-type glycerol-3-phosphate transport system substrate-binding protein